jgi:hypothetical protein
MLWAATTKSRIAIALSVPQNRIGLSYVEAAMGIIAALPVADSGYAITEIERLLDLWDAADVAVGTESSTSALIQADVLKWSDRPGARVDGLANRREEIAQRIAIALDLNYPFSMTAPLVGSSSSGRRGRS